MNKELIEKEYQKAKNTPSDINEHIEVLYAYARKCESVTEMGVRSCVASWAFIKGCPNYTGYDMFEHTNMRLLKQANPDCLIYLEDVLDVKIEPTDFLFIDTFHTASQLKRELELHADKAKKFIGFHDTHTFWETGEQPYEGMGGKGVDCGKGLRYALEPFLKEHPEWTVAYKTDRNNGLTIIQRA
jgi:hypothetical protein